VLIRRGDRQFGRALKLLETGKFAKLRKYSDEVPRIRGTCVGVVALTSSKLPGRGWQNKALDELICEQGALYGSGFDYHKHDAVYIFLVHKRWDALGLPSPAELLQTHELGKYITTRDSRRAFIEVPRGKLRNADPKTVNRTIAEAINRALPPDILAAWFENLRLPVRCPACGGGSFEFAKTPTTLKLRTKALREACLIGEFVCLGCGCAWRGVYSLGRRVQLHVRVIEQEVAG